MTRSTALLAGRLAAVAILTAWSAACRHHDPLLTPRPGDLEAVAPDSFDVRFESSRGPFVIRARRDWSPLGVDRFYYLARHGFFDEERFFRVVGGFVAQWGLSGTPAVNAAWQGKNLPDEPVKASNTRGRVSFARGGPNTRSVQLYINLVDNVRLDTTGTFGFPPIGEVVEGMAAVDSFTFEYGGRRGERVPGPSQDSIRVQGNAYLLRSFPNLDYIRTARVIRRWGDR
ncbi:MAG: peptidylprolyl isomerase [Gemmatimonadales bacterium]